MSNSLQKVEYGDFQTPSVLSNDVCNLLSLIGLQPKSVIEPTCGEGNFVISSLKVFDALRLVYCVELNPDYLSALRVKLTKEQDGDLVEIVQGDFFKQDWGHIIESAPKPLLIAGNPPWVTNSVLGKLNGTNLPTKSNFQGHRGFDALTGKSNFDISEWMLIHLLQWAAEKNTSIALLCKVSVARKVLLHRWSNDLGSYKYSIYKFDAKKSFDVSVDSCLFVAAPDPKSFNTVCNVYKGISQPVKEHIIGFKFDAVVADIARLGRSEDVLGSCEYIWRSGIKHDCARVMDLILGPDGSLSNKANKSVSIEDTYLYPLLKSSDIANCRTTFRRAVIVPQKRIGECTDHIEYDAPYTWDYLTSHRAAMDSRMSSIYRDKPPFSIFGVGAYSFSPWKIAVSGLYKKLVFTVVGPLNGRPVMLDDTCYFLPCQTEAEASLLKRLLEHRKSQDLLKSFIFWDDKRPITVNVLKKLDLYAVAEYAGLAEEYLANISSSPYTEEPQNPTVLELGLAG